MIEIEVQNQEKANQKRSKIKCSILILNINSIQKIKIKVNHTVGIIHGNNLMTKIKKLKHLSNLIEVKRKMIQK